MITKQILISGSVGIQVTPPDQSKSVILRGYSVYAPTSAATVVVRDGGGASLSGEVKHETETQSNSSSEYNFPGNGIQFLKGLHVKVTGVGSKVYLYLD